MKVVTKVVSKWLFKYHCSKRKHKIQYLPNIRMNLNGLVENKLDRSN